MADDKFSAQQMIDALISTRGMITLAAKKLGCVPNTVRRYIREYPTVAVAQSEAREQLGDAVESTLANMALGKLQKDGKKYEREPNIAALIFMAKTKFKDRGYVERTETVNFNVSTELLQRAIAAIEGAGLDPATVFETMIQEAATAHADIEGAGTTNSKPRP